MFILFGTKAREKDVGSGQFYCPRCRTNRRYTHRRASRYFTLYFIPLIPMGKLGEYVECGECGGRFDPQVLDIDPDRIEKAARPWTCPACENANPVEYTKCVSCMAPRPDSPPAGAETGEN